MITKIFATTFIAALAVAWGCSSDPSDHHGSSSGEPSPFPSCQAILDACHPADTGEGPANACHELVHDDGTEEKCAPKKVECEATCRAILADAGTTDGGDGG